MLRYRKLFGLMQGGMMKNFPVVQVKIYKQTFKIKRKTENLW